MSDTKSVKRYLVMGGHYGAMAHCNVLATNEEEALAAYHTIFDKRVEGWRAPVFMDYDADNVRFIGMSSWHFNGWWYFNLGDVTDYPASLDG